MRPVTVVIAEFSWPISTAIYEVRSVAATIPSVSPVMRAISASSMPDTAFSNAIFAVT